MPVLLLAYGDPQAKDLLRKAIESRYGLLPPAIEALHLRFKGRARAKVGPVTTWVPVDLAAYFHFPKAMRWDFTVKPLGLPVQRGVESFDGEVYRSMRGSRTSEMSAEDQLDHLRSRLWAVAALLLTPLSEGHIKLSQAGANCFNATHTMIGEMVQVMLRPDHSIEQVQVECMNPDTHKRQWFRLRPSVEHVEIEGLRLPSKIAASWDDEPSFEVEPIGADNVVNIPDGVFKLEGEA